ncbi:excalibur calcium-binding domain-containing protein [Niveibacterium sp. SC-1]|uniref:excalibur calcium-binding domain-containing protein n=1 Tax=Niveibacterium sp. SC-1 TaxID=3135646 RepID=UPI00311FC710
MKKLILVALLAIVGWQAYGKYQATQLARVHARDETSVAESDSTPSSQLAAAPNNFRCDGRTYCSQMTSCEEATFFLRNCPGVKMDGNNDGIPCERQWCK